MLSQPIVLDKFHSHKALGELIVIDRVTNMTSACGVVETIIDGDKDEFLFRKDDTALQGNLFTEYLYNTLTDNINKKAVKGGYQIGDAIPLVGESYQYPDDFDIVILRERIFVQVRGRKVEKIAPLAEYQYSNVPVINGRGFAVAITSAQDATRYGTCWILQLSRQSQR